MPSCKRELQKSRGVSRSFTEGVSREDVSQSVIVQVNKMRLCSKGHLYDLVELEYTRMLKMSCVGASPARVAGQIACMQQWS